MKRMLVIATTGAAVALGTLPAMAATGHANAKPANHCVLQGVTYRWNGPPSTSVRKIIASHPQIAAFAQAHPDLYDAVHAWVAAGCPTT